MDEKRVLMRTSSWPEGLELKPSREPSLGPHPRIAEEGPAYAVQGCCKSNDMSYSEDISNVLRLDHFHPWGLGIPRCKWEVKSISRARGRSGQAKHAQREFIKLLCQLLKVSGSITPPQTSHSIERRSYDSRKSYLACRGPH